MSTISVGQHLFGDVAVPDSPARQGGFQTIYYSSSCISASESMEIAGRLGYQATTSRPTKLLYFRLGRERFVITRVVPLDDIDEFGRKGSHVGHSFVFRAADFARLRCDPFAAFALMDAHFVSTTKEALQIGSPDSPEVGEIIVDVPAEPAVDSEKAAIVEIGHWSSAELQKLARCAASAERLAADTKSLCLAGPSTSIAATLKAALCLLPPDLRIHCSFDTHLLGCNPVANYYWAVGFPELPRPTPRFLMGDTAQRTLLDAIPTGSRPYEQWICSRIGEGACLEAMPFRSAALELERLLQCQGCDEGMLRRISPAFVDTFLNANRSALAPCVEYHLSQAVGQSLAGRIRTGVTSHLDLLEGHQVLARLLDGFDMADLASELVVALKGERPSTTEIVDLDRLQAKTGHQVLGLLLAVWKQDNTAFRGILSAMPDDRYQAATEMFLRDQLVTPDRLVRADLRDLLFVALEKAMVHSPALAQYVPALVQVLIETGRTAALARVAPLLKYENQAELGIIQKMVDRTRVPTQFRKRLEECLAKSGGAPQHHDQPSRGIFRRLLGRHW